MTTQFIKIPGTSDFLDARQVDYANGSPLRELVVLGDSDTTNVAKVIARHPGHDDYGVVTRPVMPTTAFGELNTGETIPVYQTDFVYPNAHEQLHLVTEQAGGAVTFANNLAVCTSGDTALGLAALSSKRVLKYRPGQGCIARFTALFSTPTQASVQAAGLSNGEVGLLVGYRFSTGFQCWRQTGGKREVRTLTITTGSSTAENVTVTLEGVAVSVAVTNTGSTTATAWEVAQGVYSTVADVGYDAFAEGATVVFIRKQTGPATGTFSIAGTSVVGTFAQTIAGVAPTATVVNQADFNVDPLDGTGPSGLTLDPTKGNVFQITYQYLGFGEIIFWIENTDDGVFVPFHEIRYTNENTEVSLSNPAITFSVAAYNFSGAGNNVTVKSASAMLGTQGQRNFPKVAYSSSVARSALAAARTPVLSIRLKQVYQGRLTLTEAILRALSTAVTTTKPVRAELVFNGALNNTANFALVGGDSFVMVDTSATSITGGITLFGFVLSKDGSNIVNLGGLSEITLGRFDTVSVVLTPQAGNTDADVSLAWFEDI